MRKIASCAVFFILATANAQTREWQMHIEWAIHDKGPVDCPAEYEKTAPDCIEKGGRACLMARAIAIAKKDDFNSAMRLALITQCHNQRAQQSIAEAGAEAVGNYLKTH